MTTTLSEICDDFADQIEALEPADDDLLTHLTAAIKRLARDVAEHVADHTLGEIPALLQRSHAALAAIAAEAEHRHEALIAGERDDPEDRRCRYRRQAAVLNLLMLLDSIARYHAASRAQQRKEIDALRDQVGYALAGLVEREEA